MLYSLESGKQLVSNIIDHIAEAAQAEEQKVDSSQLEASLTSRIGQMAYKALKCVAYTFAGALLGLGVGMFSLLVWPVVLVHENIKGARDSWRENENLQEIALNVLTAPLTIPAVTLFCGLANVYAFTYLGYLKANK
ncbi:MAG: hypothetical protein K0S07_1150 [Chlamydiales bacterium]|jgi:hypothetical protein|nr:hypothetical protein [Chlamydiales bacterium]